MAIVLGLVVGIAGVFLLIVLYATVMHAVCAVLNWLSRL